MSQTRTDVQVGQLRDAANRSEQFDGKRQAITLHREEIACTTEEVKGTASDLLSLRAAVRRVHAAEDAVANGPVGSGWGLYELDEARDALRAEMASIDGNGNGGAS